MIHGSHHSHIAVCAGLKVGRAKPAALLLPGLILLAASACLANGAARAGGHVWTTLGVEGNLWNAPIVGASPAEVGRHDPHHIESAPVESVQAEPKRGFPASRD
jgi:hypothetical protein